MLLKGISARWKSPSSNSSTLGEGKGYCNFADTISTALVTSVRVRMGVGRQGHFLINAVFTGMHFFQPSLVFSHPLMEILQVITTSIPESFAGQEPEQNVVVVIYIDFYRLNDFHIFVRVVWGELLLTRIDTIKLNIVLKWRCPFIIGSAS